MKSIPWLSRMRLHLTPGVGYKTYCQLLKFYAEEEIFQVSAEDLQKIPGIGPIKALRLKDLQYLEQAKQELDRIEQHHIQLLPWEELPFLLAQICDPPLLLYVKGSLPSDFSRVTIVGTRRCSPYGRNETFRLSRQLAEAGIWVLSGLAEGIDTAAHQGVLASGTGRTLAVLGSGFQQIYPPRNKKLAEQIVEQGGVLFSEFALTQPPQKGHFPRRNRILAGMVNLVVLMEAPERSGALITADLALEYGREVFVVPGPISSPSCKGSNRFLKEGAQICLGIEDILDYFGMSSQTKVRPVLKMESLDPESQKVYQALLSGPQGIESLEISCQLPILGLLRILGNLEIQGILQHRGGRYQLTET
ncbi:MAG: DNA-processing protein DprA [Planctomycetota bacterium]